jgi:hypothetical protein
VRQFRFAVDPNVTIFTTPPGIETKSVLKALKNSFGIVVLLNAVPRESPSTTAEKRISTVRKLRLIDLAINPALV